MNYKAIRTNRFKFIDHHALSFNSVSYPPEQELYDLAVDPYELNNLIGDAAYASVVSELQRQLGILRLCAGPTCWMADPEPVGP